MTSRRYRTDDFDEIKSWYNNRRMVPVAGLIPSFGFIVPGVAAGFMMATDTECCIFEPFISNPNVDLEFRDEALRRIMQDLLNEATLQGFTKVFGFSTSPTMVNRALDWGFKIIETNAITVCKELK